MRDAGGAGTGPLEHIAWKGKETTATFDVEVSVDVISEFVVWLCCSILSLKVELNGI